MNTIRLRAKGFVLLMLVWTVLIAWSGISYAAPLEGTLHAQISEGTDAARAPLIIEKGRVAMLFALRSEVALTILNAPRTSGGNESSWGDFYANLTGNFEYDTLDGYVGFIGDIVPESSVLNFQVSEERNEHNANRMRADGFLSRPYVLAHIYYAREPGDPDHPVVLRLGAMKFAGLEPMDDTMTAYYATRLSPIV